MVNQRIEEAEKKRSHLVEKVIQIAVCAHAGQVDKAGYPYIFHPIRLMTAMAGEHEKMAAILHDVIEDTTVSLEDLKKEGFPPAVVDAVDTLTKRNGESRLEAAARALRNPIARIVKLADVKDNMNLSRINTPSKKDYARLQEYEQVRAYLEDGIKRRLS